MFAADAHNPWIASANAARRRAPGWLLLAAASLFAAAVLLVSRLAAPALAGLVAGQGGSQPSPWPALLQDVLFNIVVFGPLLAAPALAAALEGRRIWLLGSAADGLVGLACGLGGFGVSLALAGLAGVVSRGGAALPSGYLGVLVGVALFAFQAGAEEVYFRAWIQPVLCARWGPWPGVLATALVFAALHVLGGARSPLALANLFLGGLVFGLLALRTGGLLAPFLAHFSWNWLEACGVGLEPNPGVGPTGALANLDLSGPALWSGGGDDMNGSVATTVVLLCLVLGVLAAAPIRSAAPAGRRSGSAP